MDKRVGKKIVLAVAVLLMGIFIFLFFIRLLSHKELDDVTPGIQCDKELLDKADVLWVIPNYNNVSITENKKWCAYILSLNKTIGMHGVTHEYQEFGTDRNQEYLEDSMKSFEDCFGFEPEMFKPPQIKISKNNVDLIKNNNLELKGKVNQITHKVYHCNDSDRIKNWVIDLF